MRLPSVMLCNAIRSGFSRGCRASTRSPRHHMRPFSLSNHIAYMIVLSCPHPSGIKERIYSLQQEHTTGLQHPSSRLGTEGARAQTCCGH